MGKLDIVFARVLLSLCTRYVSFLGSCLTMRISFFLMRRRDRQFNRNRRILIRQKLAAGRISAEAQKLPAGDWQPLRYLLPIALVLSIGAHALAIWKLPAEVFFQYEKSKPETVLELELMPPTVEPPARTPPEQYVVTNPNVPQNEPDETLNFSDRSQQLAQETQAEVPVNETVTVEDGREEAQSILQAQPELTPEPLLIPGNREAQAEELQQTEAQGQSSQQAGNAGDNGLFLLPAPARESLFDPALEPRGLDSLLGQEKPEQEPDTLLLGSVISELLGRGTSGDNRESAEGQQTSDTQAQQPGDAAVVPRPRPRLDPQTVGVMRKSIGNTGRSGLKAENARFSEFGKYLTRMQEAINARASSLVLNSSTLYGTGGTRVIIRFELDRDGNVHHLQVLDASAGPLAVQFCSDAIRSRAPFGPWTQEMVSTLNEREPITYRFLF